VPCSRGCPMNKSSASSLARTSISPGSSS
jgi:hypothetical protein